MSRHEARRREDRRTRHLRVEGLEGRELMTGFTISLKDVIVTGVQAVAQPTTAEPSSLIGITAIEFKNTGTSAVRPAEFVIL
jgi:hypothetical protein